LQRLLQGNQCIRGYSLAPGALPPRSWLDQTRYLAGNSERGYRWSVPYLIALPGEGRIVGSIGGKGIVAVEEEAEIGYNVAAPYRRRGIATAALQRIMRLAGREGIRLVAHTAPDNLASRAALLRAGFTYQTTLSLPGGLRLQRFNWSAD
jgi:RimJ/RimL family protein N-acetyltransferase